MGFQYENFDHELTRETFLKKKFNIKVHDNRRIDTVAFENRDTLLIVELKRPRVKAGEKQFKQIENYVDFIRGSLGSSEKTGIYHVEGILVVGDISTSNKKLPSARNRLERDQIYVVTWNDLIAKARQTLRKLTS